MWVFPRVVIHTPAYLLFGEEAASETALSRGVVTGGALAGRQAHRHLLNAGWLHICCVLGAVRVPTVLLFHLVPIL